MSSLVTNFKAYKAKQIKAKGIYLVPLAWEMLSPFALHCSLPGAHWSGHLGFCSEPTLNWWHLPLKVTHSQGEQSDAQKSSTQAFSKQLLKDVKEGRTNFTYTALNLRTTVISYTQFLDLSFKKKTTATGIKCSWFHPEVQMDIFVVKSAEKLFLRKLHMKQLGGKKWRHILLANSQTHVPGGLLMLRGFSATLSGIKPILKEWEPRATFSLKSFSTSLTQKFCRLTSTQK